MDLDYPRLPKAPAPLAQIKPLQSCSDLSWSTLFKGEGTASQDYMGQAFSVTLRVPLWDVLFPVSQART